MLTVCPLLVCSALGVSTVWGGKYNPELEIGEKAPSWSMLPGVDDKAHSLHQLKKKEVVVVVFTCNSCPYAEDYEDRIVRFANEQCGAQAKVALVAINVNQIKADRLPAMKKRAEQKKFPFPYLFDETQRIAIQFGAVRTPEFFVLDKERRVVYMGAMDDSADAKKVQRRFLEQAVTATLANGKVVIAETAPIGCSIRYERRRRPRSNSQ